MKGSLVIIAFFVIGCFFGASGILPVHVIPEGSSMGVLCLLMTLVGVAVGLDTSLFRKIREIDKRTLLLPLVTIVCSLLGSAVVGALLGARPLWDYLAVGSGMGYYSLSSVLIAEMKGAELGTIALLANVIREILTLVGAGVYVRWFGRMAPISVGGPTSMDTSLPIILQTSGQEFLVVTLFHGFLTDLSVPFLVTFFCSL